MTHVELNSKVGPDGVLTLAVPVGPENANREVKVSIDMLDAKTPRRKMTQREWEEFIDRTAGSLDDPTFIRHDQGQLQERDELFP